MILNININIDTSNSAFGEDFEDTAFDEDMATEVQNILIKHLKVKYLLPSIDKPIRDSNGNCVGFITATLLTDSGKKYECFATNSNGMSKHSDNTLSDNTLSVLEEFRHLNNIQ